MNQIGSISVACFSTRLRLGLAGAAIAMPLALLAGPGARLVPAAPASRPAEDPKRDERLKWENAIVFFGEEDTGNYSIRILDKSVTAPATFRYLELWEYDVKEKTWLKIDNRQQTTRIVLPKDKPADAPEGNQLLADIPVTQDKVGLYYCKWQVNGIDGATLTRIGPGHAGKPPALGPTPAGMIATDVPLDKNHGTVMFVPDPRTHTGKPGQ